MMEGCHWTIQVSPAVDDAVLAPQMLPNHLHLCIRKTPMNALLHGNVPPWLSFVLALLLSISSCIHP